MLGVRGVPKPCVTACEPHRVQVMLGENGTGKTTFIRMLAGALDADRADGDIPQFRVSYKPQKISPKFPGSVRSPAHVSQHRSQTLQAMHAAGSTPAARTWSVAALILARACVLLEPEDGA